jgi:hypothetical protein
MPFGDDDGYGTKVLGLAWYPDQDYFGCALNLEPSPVFTKRGILSLVVRIFDPVGLFGPVVFLAKAIMQRNGDTVSYGTTRCRTNSRGLVRTCF